MAKGLTRRQADILHFIVRCIRDNGMPPTIAEIGRRFNISSTNGVNDHLVALERKGCIERTSKARSIRVTGEGAAGLYGAGATMVPLVGRIAAGIPILAEENIEDTIPVAPALGVEGGYALRVQGDSMIEDGILEGDTIIVDPQRRVRRGDIVVALVNDEATVKHFYAQGDMVELRPANAAMQPIRVPARDVQVQGVVVGLQRTFG
ncbi:MAG TPA: transcriptional repressor LexA [Candidatus Hydrogenedentes bacterium]|nr:transcriptional repressor LexA [Candidatus Hydrogenedentota bacterium]HQE82337.1 transcriptional repressor LexA [Candidatus Hydrogenedentota bacterium]HQM50800.1 transcriptional repressor LexA [Candidatus Hydrogenedentota bacterium]